MTSLCHPLVCFTFRTAVPMPSRFIWFRQGASIIKAIDNSPPTMPRNPGNSSSGIKAIDNSHLTMPRKPQIIVVEQQYYSAFMAVIGIDYDSNLLLVSVVIQGKGCKCILNA